MKNEALEKQLSALREGDQVIADKLGELDDQLAAWMTAMRAGQTVIVDGLADLAARVTGPTEPTETRDPEAEPPGDVATDASREATGQDAVDEDPVDDEIGLFESPVLPTEQPEPAGLTQQEEDEALLAELDTETATLIRVKRRLSNKPRSVRELLEEIRAEQGRAQTEKKETSRWWRRK